MDGDLGLSIEEMKDVDVTKVNPEDLVDIRDVKVNAHLKQEKKMEDFIRQIKNPYCYKYGEYIVIIGFEDTSVTLTERLREMILKAAGSAQ